MTNIVKYLAIGLVWIASSCTNSESTMENITFNYWIQKHDYSSHDFGLASVEESIKAFYEFDWDLELSLYKEGRGDKDCPSGIGINSGYDKNNSKKSLLHICPETQKSVFFNLHYPVVKKFLGFVPFTNEEIYYANDVPKETVSEIIRLFFDSNFEKIMEITANK